MTIKYLFSIFKHYFIIYYYSFAHGVKKLKKNQKYIFALGVGIFFSLLLTCSSLSQINPVNVSEENTLNIAITPDPDLTDGGASYSNFNLTIAEPGVSGFGVWCNVTEDEGWSSVFSYNVSFYASLDTDINGTTGDYLIGIEILPELLADDSVLVTWEGTFPGSIPDGTYYIGWIIELDEMHDDPNPANNIWYETSKTLTVQTSSGGGPPQPPPDPIPFVVGGVVAAVVIVPAGFYFISKRRV